jgi:hypothetical protein
MDELNSLLSCGFPWAVSRAQTALEITSAVHGNQISKSEATELLQDLLNTDKLDKEANNFAIKTELVNAITALISVVEAIPGL